MDTIGVDNDKVFVTKFTSQTVVIEVAPKLDVKT